MTISRFALAISICFLLSNTSSMFAMLSPEDLNSLNTQPTNMELFKSHGTSFVRSAAFSAAGAGVGIIFAAQTKDALKEHPGMFKILQLTGWVLGTTAEWMYFGKEDQNRNSKALGSLLGGVVALGFAPKPKSIAAKNS